MHETQNNNIVFGVLAKMKQWFLLYGTWFACYSILTPVHNKLMTCDSLSWEKKKYSSSFIWNSFQIESQ